MSRQHANELFRGGKYQQASTVYAKLLDGADDSERLALSCNIAACELKLQNWSACVAAADNALRINPLCAKALFRKATVRHCEVMSC